MKDKAPKVRNTLGNKLAVDPTAQFSEDKYFHGFLSTPQGIVAMLVNEDGIVGYYPYNHVKFVS